MGETTNLLMAFGAMVLATQVSRLGPLVLSSVTMPKGLEAWLGHIPIAILTALVIPELVSPGPRGLSYDGAFLLASVLCLGVGLKYRNILLTIFVGVSFMALYRLYFYG